MFPARDKRGMFFIVVRFPLLSLLLLNIENRECTIFKTVLLGFGDDFIFSFVFRTICWITTIISSEPILTTLPNNLFIALESPLSVSIRFSLISSFNPSLIAAYNSWDIKEIS